MLIFLSMACASEAAITGELDKQVHINEHAIVEEATLEKSILEKAKSAGLCMAESLDVVINWVAEKIEFIDEKYLRSSDPDEIAEPSTSPNVIKEKSVSKQALDLTIPDIEYQGTMEMGNGMALQLPDLFAAPEHQPYIKEKPGASFGGRILMDDEEMEGMQEYRFEDVRDAVRGAEVSLEFKTN